MSQKTDISSYPIIYGLHNLSVKCIFRAFHYSLRLSLALLCLSSEQLVHRSHVLTQRGPVASRIVALLASKSDSFVHNLNVTLQGVLVTTLEITKLAQEFPLLMHGHDMIYKVSLLDILVLTAFTLKLTIFVSLIFFILILRAHNSSRHVFYSSRGIVTSVEKLC